MTGTAPSRSALAADDGPGSTTAEPSVAGDAFDLASVITLAAIAMGPPEQTPCSLPKNDLNSAIAYFHCRERQASPQKQIKARDDVQTAIVKASNRLCAVFISHLDRQLHTWAISGKKIPRAADILLSPEEMDEVSQPDSPPGLFDHEYLNRLCPVTAITATVNTAIDRLRQRALRPMTQGKDQRLADYPLEAAIRDALFYHGQCSALACLAEIATMIGQTSRGWSKPTTECTPSAPRGQKDDSNPFNTKEKQQ